MLKNKQKEIEIKLVYKNKNVVTKVLKKLKAKYLGKKLIHDRYYSQKYKDMKNIHQLLRIREINNKKSELTLKGKCKDKNNVWQRTELTTKIECAKSMNDLLLTLAFKLISEYKCQREIWQKDNLEIAFVSFTYPTNLRFIEIEGTSYKKVKKLAVELKKSPTIKELGEEIFKVFDNLRK